ncbi:hypothetical protein [Spirillospora sp. NPDC029432]|uniref:hypothetical protein n=1 Tax=Spirillospora sp. NPDC029432 TaxID=3154599 RepID=UPI003454AF1B
MRLRTVPGRLTTGAFIVHSGLEKWKGGEEKAAAIHGMAAGAFPFLNEVPPRKLLRALAAGEIATGTVLLAPFVPAALAGAALSVFSGGLVAFYLRTPGMRKPGSIWPTDQGLGVSKDVWMLGIGLGLLAECSENRSRRLEK